MIAMQADMWHMRGFSLALVYPRNDTFETRCVAPHETTQHTLGVP
jgi:hypothetical protein